jgi:GH24 family phage-related lysozyme (muramidase)
MARSAIPGPLDADSELPEGDPSRLRWPYRAGIAFRHHRPGPLGLGVEPEPGWTHVRASTWSILDTFVADLKGAEGLVPHMYLCTKGRVTIGIGNMMPTVADAKRLPLLNADTGVAASEAEIASAYATVSQMTWGMKSTKYKLKPSLEITEDYAFELAIKRLNKEYLPEIRRRFHDFDDYPSAARRFMVDMAYNGGPGFFAKRGMVDLIKKRDWLACIPLVPVPPDPKKQGRMRWRHRMLREAASADAP